MDFAAIYSEALTAANATADAENTRLGPENSRGFDCGFAWVDVETPRGGHSEAVKGFVKHCKAAGLGSARGYGKSAWQFWSPAKAQTQSISVHSAGAQAFALVLRNHGIETAHAGSRLD